MLSSISKGEKYVVGDIYAWILIVVTQKKENVAGNDLFYYALMTLPLSSFSFTTAPMRARDVDFVACVVRVDETQQCTIFIKHTREI